MHIGATPLKNFQQSHQGLLKIINALTEKDPVDFGDFRMQVGEAGVQSLSLVILPILLRPIGVAPSPDVLTNFLHMHQRNDALIAFERPVNLLGAVGRVDRMGRNDEQKVVGFVDPVVNLILVIDAQGNILEVIPDIQARCNQPIIELGGKRFAVCAAIGNKGVLESMHGLGLKGAALGQNSFDN